MTCSVCGRDWAHVTPVRSRRFVCGDCCKLRDLPPAKSARSVPATWAPPVLSLAAARRLRAERKLETDAAFEDGAKAIEDGGRAAA